MRRILALILCILLLVGTVYAENAVSSASSTGSVASGGSCQIAMTLTIRLDSPVSQLLFPLGAEVSSVTLNGRNASLKTENGITCVSLSYLKNQTGSFPVTIYYTLNNVIETDDTGKQTIRIPLLYGFEFPVEQLQFSVSMPGAFEAEPVFYSGYHEQDIERSLSYSVTENVISGAITAPLKDSETLFLTLAAPEGMFPRAQAAGGSLTFDTWMMGIFAALTCLYWLLTMSRLPRFGIYRSTPPDGISAGVVGSYLHHAPADLTMMVIHWGQLGYLIIHLDDHGRVLLHKKMDMGNERSVFEQKCFRVLFSKKQMVDATGYRYARLWSETARISRRYAAGYRKGSGNPVLLRILACGVGLFAGIALGDCLTTNPAWRVIWMVFFGVLTPLALWVIQKAAFCLRLYDKSDLIYGIIAACGLLILSLIIPGALVYGLVALGWGILAGLMGAFGGKRNENGDRTNSDLVGLRKYMRKVTKAELARILRSNPDYYYELAPFAIAMGVDRKFAKQFENLRIPSCNWLVINGAPPRIAGEWYPLLQEAVDAMNAIAKRPFWEKMMEK